MSPVLVGVAAYLIALSIALGFMLALGRAAKYADEIENRRRRETLPDRDRPAALLPFRPRASACSGIPSRQVEHRAASSVQNLGFYS